MNGKLSLFIFLLMVGLVGFVGFVFADISAITSDSKSFTYTSQEGTPFETQFKSDGTKMYMIGLDNDTIYQYSLSSAWDVSTASYDSVSFSVNAQESVPEGLFFKPDGTTMYVIGVAGDRAYQYTLSTPWDLSTASYASKSSPSNGSNDATTVKVHFNTAGTKMYLTGFVNGRIYQYSLSSAWDVSTATYDSVNFSVLSQTSNTYATTFNSNGTKLFAVGPSDVIYQYSLSSAWDISTASYDSLSFNANSVDSNLYGLTLKPDGTKIYFTGAINNKVYQYTIDLGDLTAPAVSTFSPTDNAVSVAVDSNLVITFDEVVDVETGNITIKKTSNNSTVEIIDVTSGQVSGTGTTEITINPSADFDGDVEYYVQIDATAFDDSTSNSYAGISDTTTWNFTAVGTIGRRRSDTNPPISSITSLVNGEIVFVDTSYIITGTSAETGSLKGAVAMVEISFNNGDWRIVKPTTPAQNSGFNWEYNWNDMSLGTFIIKTRATDWSNNVERVMSDTRIVVMNRIKEAIIKDVEEVDVIESVNKKSTVIQKDVKISCVDGGLTRNEGNTKVYVTGVDGIKIHVQNEEVFNACGYNWKDVVVIQAFINKKASEKKIKIITDVLRVRKFPSLNSIILTKVARGFTYSIISKKDTWIQIQLPNNKNGWVYSQYTKSVL